MRKPMLMSFSYVVLVLVLVVLVIALPVAAQSMDGDDDHNKQVEEWFQNVSEAKEKLTKLHFYFHDTVSGKKPSAVQVAQANTTSASPALFGTVFVMDDLLTTSPDPNSEMVGRAQGIYAAVSQQEIGFLMALNFVFTHGNFKGSTLSILGHNPIFHQYRELPISSGSGAFRLARGVATAKTYFFNTTTTDAVVEYNVVVLHY